MGVRILLVDDEAAILSTLKVILETKGHGVVPARSAVEACAALSKQAFDVVITDVKMETGTSGYDVARTARAQPYAPLIVILTALPIQGQQWRQAGADAALIKPVRIEELLSTISKLVAGRSPRKGREAK
jgi:CheY-like chemotaxis protein